MKKVQRVQKEQRSTSSRAAALHSSSPDSLAGINNSPVMSAQRKITDAIHQSPRAQSQQKSMQLFAQEQQPAPEAAQLVEDEEMLQGKFETAQLVEDEEMLQGKFETAQLVEDEEMLQGKFETAQLVEDEEILQGKFESGTAAQLEAEPAGKTNNSGLPAGLKAGIEGISNIAMDDVKVHYNSDKPAQLNAHAYAQGSDIHLASGQEKHLPHEAWHVVQQKQGRVKPTLSMNGASVNDDVGLETEADVMGAKSLAQAPIQQMAKKKIAQSSDSPAQLWRFWKKKKNEPAVPDPTVQPDVSYEEALASYKDEEKDPADTVAEVESDLIGAITDTTGGTQAAPTFTDANSGDNGTVAATGKDQVDKSSGEQQAEAFGVGLALAAPILSFYMSVKKLGSGELNDRIEGGFELLASGSSAVKAGADVAKTLDPKDTTASVTSAVAGSVTDGLNGLKAGVLAIKGIYDAYKDATSAEGSSTRDKIAAGLQVTKGLVTSASGIVASLKAILDLFKQGSAGMANAIPGLGIALSAVQIAIDVYEIIKAKTNEGFINAQLEKNQWEMTLSKGKKKRKTQDDNQALFKSEIDRFEREGNELKAQQAELRAQGKKEEADALDAKIASKQELFTLGMQSLSSLEKNIALTNLKQVNVDKTSNAAFSIGVELTKVIGSVLSLVPEPGSQVASVTLKAAASGASLAKKVGDKLKQSARDHAAANPDSFLNRVVDTTRSSDKELARKKMSVKYIFDSICSTDLENPKAVTDTTNLVSTSGMSAESLLRSYNSGGINKAVSDMIKAQG